MTYTTTYVPSRAVPPAIAPYADPLNILFTENCWSLGSLGPWCPWCTTAYGLTGHLIDSDPAAALP